MEKDAEEIFEFLFRSLRFLFKSLFLKLLYLLIGLSKLVDFGLFGKLVTSRIF